MNEGSGGVPPAFAYPAFLEVRGRHCLVVGGGREARAKADALADLGAIVTVLDQSHPETRALAGRPGVTLLDGAIDAGLLEGAFLVIAASDDRMQRRRVATMAREAGIMVNAVDESDLCDFAAPAILRRGGLTVAFGTGGVAPALGVRLRDRLAEELGPEYADLLALFGEVRPRIMASGRPFADRRRLWYSLVDGPALDALRVDGREAARSVVLAAIEAWEASGQVAASDAAVQGPSPGGRGAEASGGGFVWLVGAGPGDPELLTLRAYRLIREADVVVHDRLVGPGVLDLVPPGRPRFDVGKTGYGTSASQSDIDALLVRLAGEGRRVVRLKGGDPFVFGRGGEEVAALRAAGIPFEVVPGITAGLAGPALAGIPVTRRGVARSVALVTGSFDQADEQESGADWPSLAGVDTLIVYMAGRSGPRVAASLLAAGRQASTPVAVIRDASLPSQDVRRTDLASLATSGPDSSGRATLLVIGDVVGLAVLPELPDLGPVPELSDLGPVPEVPDLGPVPELTSAVPVGVHAP